MDYKYKSLDYVDCKLRYEIVEHDTSGNDYSISENRTIDAAIHKIEKLIKQNERQGITDYTYRIFDRLERCYLKTLVSY